MKLSCLQENLAKSLAIVGRAVATRTTLPVLSNIYMATDNGRLKLAATNLELSIVTWVDAKVSEEGAITVPARLLTELVSSLPNDIVSMSLNERSHTLRLSCACSDANIKGIEASEFPPIPTLSTTATIKIEPDVLRSMISQVIFAASDNETRPVLAGILVSFTGDKLIMAATDGFRLSVYQLPIETQQKVDIIVPATAMKEVARLAAGITEPIVVISEQNQILFRLPNIELVSRLIEGTFPNYNHIIPQGHTTRSVLATTDFLNATRRASFFAHEAANMVHLSIQKADELTPSRVSGKAVSAEVGDTVDDVEAVIEGKSLNIGFNVLYLSEVLAVCGTSQVGLETGTDKSPAVIRPVGQDGFLHVIMPLQLPK